MTTTNTRALSKVTYKYNDYEQIEMSLDNTKTVKTHFDFTDTEEPIHIFNCSRDLKTLGISRFHLVFDEDEGFKITDFDLH